MLQYPVSRLLVQSFFVAGNGKTGMGITRGTVMDKVPDEASDYVDMLLLLYC